MWCELVARRLGSMAQGCLFPPSANYQPPDATCAAGWRPQHRHCIALATDRRARTRRHRVASPAGSIGSSKEVVLRARFHALQSTAGVVLLAVAVACGAAAQTGPYRPPPGSLATSTIMWHLDSACTAGALAACDTLGMHHWATRDPRERRGAPGRWGRA